MNRTDKNGLGPLITEALFTAMQNLRDGTITAKEANQVSAAARVLIRFMGRDLSRREREIRNRKAETPGTRMPRVPNGDVNQTTNRNPLKGCARGEPVTEKGDGPCTER